MYFQYIRYFGILAKQKWLLVGEELARPHVLVLCAMFSYEVVYLELGLGVFSAKRVFHGIVGRIVLVSGCVWGVCFRAFMIDVVPF
ncbi:hypothetical protein [Neorickettsia sennetsu]|uniref:Uncharacterized protein n=1 Tax=Ehrlichia sennetsu (strain ATCC VR-367 / Miyayama) TaxID=222891 RepID=Q2GF32_EHRS3|nr:hypothetical protein [Neorickettsia sennetsu]ABD46340.1 hypothetical protein NSE_0021 [Neorickettsia sennetsu str. Miyayama]